MKTKSPTIIERSVESAHAWINDMASELDTDDQAEACDCYAHSSTRCAID